MVYKHLARTFNGSLMAIGAAVLIAGSIAPVQAGTGTLTLTGHIPNNCTVAITPTAAATTLDLSVNSAGVIPGNTATGPLVATVIETCNDNAGYTVTVTTANGTNSGLFKGSLSTDTVPYSFYYGPANGNPTQATFSTGTATITPAGTKTTGAGVTNNAYVSYTGAPTLTADPNYTDTLTFNITGN